jgi:hypothetical protein
MAGLKPGSDQELALGLCNNDVIVKRAWKIKAVSAISAQEPATREQPAKKQRKDRSHTE